MPAGGESRGEKLEVVFKLCPGQCRDLLAALGKGQPILGLFDRHSCCTYEITAHKPLMNVLIKRVTRVYNIFMGKARSDPCLSQAP